MGTVVVPYHSTHIGLEEFAVSDLLEVDAEEERAKEQNDRHEEHVWCQLQVLGAMVPHVVPQGPPQQRTVPHRVILGAIPAGVVKK